MPVRNTMSAIQREIAAGEHPAPTHLSIPAGFGYPTYEDRKITRRFIIEEDDDGNKTKRRGRDEVRTVEHQARCSSRLISQDGTEILQCRDGWHVFNSGGRRVTQNGSPNPEKAWGSQRVRRHENNRRSGGRRR